MDNCPTYASFDPLVLIYWCAGLHEVKYHDDETYAKPAFVCAAQCFGNADAAYDVEPLARMPIGHGDAVSLIHVIMVLLPMVEMEWLLGSYSIHPIRFSLPFEIHSEGGPSLLCYCNVEKQRISWIV